MRSTSRAGIRIGIVAAVATAGAGGLTAGVDARSVNRQREARVELGRRLFLDPVASRGGRFSCASCHDPEHGFSDPRQRSVDENGVSARHSQPTLDLAGDGFHWDGEFDTLEQLLVARLDLAQAALEQTVALLDERMQVAVAAGGPVDEGRYVGRRSVARPPYYGKRGPRLTSGPPVVARLELDGRYDEGFLRAYGSRTIEPGRVIDAVASYLATLRTEENAYDRHRRGDRDALSASARRGLRLFEGKAGCATCHETSGKDRRRLSDGAFHDTGVAYRAQVLSDLAAVLPAAPITLDRPRDVGRAGQTFQIGRHTAQFKTPSLRDVATRPPYMHDGSLTTLADVVAYYDGGGTPHPGLDGAIKPLRLTAGEKADLVSFLESLTGGERPGLGPVPGYRPEETQIRVVDLQRRPVAHHTIRVVPAGDRLVGTDAMPQPFTVETDEWGRAGFVFPLSTQVRLESDELEIGLTRLIPDWTRKVDLLATPRDVVAVQLRRATKTPLPAEITVTPAAIEGGRTVTPVTLVRTQRLDDDRALYTAPRDAFDGMPGRTADGFVDVRVIVDGQGTSLERLDVSGGQSEPFDLRRDETFPIAGGVTVPLHRPNLGGSPPARPRDSRGARGMDLRDLPLGAGGGPAGGAGGGARAR